MPPATNHHDVLLPSASSSPAKKLKDLLSNGSFQEALSLFKHLHSSSIPIPPSLLPSLLKASSLPLALQLHSSLLKTNLLSHPVTLNSLLSAYSAHSSLASARRLFDSAPLRDPVTWSSILLSYARAGRLSESLHLLRAMTSAGVLPKPELVASVVSLCGRLGDLRLGRAIHARSFVNSTVGRCVLLQTSLVDMYSKCDDLRSALQLFHRMPERNVVSWTAMVSGLVASGRYAEGIDLVRRMGREGGQPPVRATAVAVLPACGGLEALKLGKEVHGFAYRRGFESESRTVVGLVGMYSRCPGGIGPALLAFQRAAADGRDVITWSSMMEATSRAGHGVRTFELFGRMRRDGVEPNSVTMLAVVDACVGLASLDHGRAALGYILKSGFLSNVCLGNSLINMFAKCGCVDSSARVFFELMPARDSISYSSMIQSYGLHGRGRDAVGLFEEMRASGLEPDDVALLALLSACNHSGLVGEAKEIFDSATSGGCGDGLSLEQYSCYVDLLGKAGMVREAFEVVAKMPMRPSMRIQTLLALACRAHGKLQMAEELALELIDLEPENAANYTLLSAIYAEGGRWDGVEEVGKVMRERGLRKDSGKSRI
ncbi:pentatricopeptide repeat-containing protein, mitochondrial [Iris pallida]|uniref:Pentatricopeptide repeat-containing protein, mitochondrial n=1 Tax=Iris pallida TaxID=29817 RepID=A0AAX6G1D8_IRIPA|nr:pentatricopeptide repeat-containing protein, mitochondrial [Iris pallida]KAJ6837307.1 pentatricopeptide repeat-containing protein, mitochondrial [Iris pallida]